MDSNEPAEAYVPVWRREPKELSYAEELRRRFKKYYGYKPCGVPLDKLEQLVRDAELKDRFNFNAGRPEGVPAVDPNARATIGDALNNKR